MSVDRYRPPASSELGPPPFGDEGGRLRLLGRLRWAFVAANVGYAAAQTVVWQGVTALARIDGLVFVAGLVEIVAFLAFGGALLWVLAGAHRNAALIARTPLEHLGVAGIGWCFVPIVNLYAPFYLTRELWRLSTAPHDRSRRMPASFVHWSSAWIAAWSFGLGWRWFGRFDPAVGIALSWAATSMGIHAAGQALATMRSLVARQRDAWKEAP